MQGNNLLSSEEEEFEALGIRGKVLLTVGQEVHRGILRVAKERNVLVLLSSSATEISKASLSYVKG